MNKKRLIQLLILVFAFTLVSPMLQQAYAEHNATIVWLETGTDTMMRPLYEGGRWPWLNFTVTNWEDSANAIIKFKFLIPKNGTSYAKFKYWESIVEPAGWSVTPDEFDPTGWATVLIFKSEGENPIAPSETYEFDVMFTDSRVKVCKNTFVIYTIDDGSPPETKPHEIHLVVDPDPPKVNMIDPASEDNEITAIFDPYPNEWYMWIKFTADDTVGTHDTNISRVKVMMDNEVIDDTPYKPPVPKVSYGEKLWGLKNGTHTLTVIVWDGALNNGTIIHKFAFIVPVYFILTPDRGTVGRYNTYDKSTGVWSGSISDEYGHKRLGTRVVANGLEAPSPLEGFTPNSNVNIYVDHPLYEGRILVCKDVPTDSQGRFECSFLFPTGPKGIYKVTAEDRKEITDYAYFTIVPEIIYKPEIVIGPAKIEAIATGLTSDGSIDQFMIDNTDALLTANMHTILYWTSTEFGVLRTEKAHAQGFLLPILENGEYNITLRIVDGSWWDGSASTWKESTLEISNKVHVVNGLQEILDLMPKITDIQNNIVDILIPEVTNIELKLDDIKPKVTRIDGNVVYIKTLLEDINGTITRVDDNVAYIKTSEGWDIRLNVSEILREGVPVSTDEITMPLTITAVLSAIAAIAAILAVVVVVKRLKVAA